jgi:hypothetical protein
MMFTAFIRSILGAVIVGAAVLAALPASADDIAAIDPQARVGPAGWRVDGVTGEATVRRGSAPAARLAIGQVVSIGSEVQTGPGTVVFLSRNGDRLVIQPSSQMRIAEPEPGGLIDHFMQSLGSVFYDVEPRRNRSFGVRAPYVAAVVKGTRFLVTVDPEKNSVRVDEGRVLVTSEDGTSSAMVDAGQVATVSATSSFINVADSGIPVEAPEDDVGVQGSVEDGGANAVDATAGSVANAVRSSTSAVGKAVTQTGDAVGKVSEGVGDAVGGASSAVGGAVAGVGDAVGGAVGGPVGGAVSGATGAVGGAVSGVGGAVGGVVGGVGGAVGGAVGGLGGLLNR